MLSVGHHFTTKHKKSIKDQADNAESIKRVISCYGKQANTFKVFATAKTHVTKASYSIAKCRKPFTDVEKGFSLKLRISV